MAHAGSGLDDSIWGDQEAPESISGTLMPSVEPSISPLQKLQSADYEELGRPYGVSGDEILVLLEAVSKGISLKDITDSLGIPASVAAQLGQDGKIVKLVQLEVGFKVNVKASINDLLDDIELSCLQNIKLAVPNMTPMEQLATMSKVNAAKRKTHQFKPKDVTAALGGEASGSELVELTVVPPMRPAFELDENNNITSVSGKDMKTLSNVRLREMVQNLENKSLEGGTHEHLEIEGNKEEFEGS